MKRDKTCEQVLLEYINSNEGFHAKVDLYVIARDWSPESAGRALRLAKKKGLIQVAYYDSKYAKNLCKYASLETVIKKTTFTLVDLPNGERVAIMN